MQPRFMWLVQLNKTYNCYFVVSTKFMFSFRKYSPLCLPKKKKKTYGIKVNILKNKHR